MTHTAAQHVGPSPLAAIHTARKARLQRFADAAARYKDARQTEVLEQHFEMPVEALPAKLAPTSRREYESKDRPSAYVPVARRILRAVAAEFEITIEEMTAPCRDAKHSIPRFVTIGLMFEMTRLSLPAIGRQLGGRDHTTILHGRKRIESLLEGEAFRNRFDQIKAGLV